MMLRPLFGLLVAPVIPALAAALLAGGHGPAFDYDTASVIAVTCIASGYLSGFCVGWPLLSLWRSMRWTGPIAGVMLGSTSAACLTFVVAMTMAPFHAGVTPMRGLVNLLCFTIPVGAVAGLAFWWLSMRSPDDSLTT